MSTVVSVDWDYFFPHLNEFDWGHREAGIHWEVTWWARCHDVSYITGKETLDIMVPDSSLLENFWDKVCPKGITMLAIGESHLDLLKFLEFLKPDLVINYDTHHDYYYGKPPKSKKEVDCSNWAYWSMKKKYVKSIKWVHSPLLETEVPVDIPYNFIVQTEPVTDIEEVTLLFICRSFAWTPTWADDAWLRFIGEWETRSPRVWENKFTAPSTSIQRHPTYEEALSQRTKIRKQLQHWKDGLDTDA